MYMLCLVIFVIRHIIICRTADILHQAIIDLSAAFRQVHLLHEGAAARVGTVVLH